MERTETRNPEPGALVAPGEIRELVARLTEQSVEAIPAGEARTLEGLALETGIPVARLREGLAELRRTRRLIPPPLAWVAFAALAGVGVWAVRHTPTPSVEAVAPTALASLPAKIEEDLAGTVSLTAVTYGPDVGSLHVDPSFVPSRPLPEGVSLSATAGDLLWGAGDHRARALDRPLPPEDAATVQAVAEELLLYAREGAAKRHAASPERLTLTGESYGGSSSRSAEFPPVDDPEPAAASRVAKGVAKKMVDVLQSQLRWRRSIRRQQGP